MWMTVLTKCLNVCKSLWRVETEASANVQPQLAQETKRRQSRWGSGTSLLAGSRFFIWSFNTHHFRDRKRDRQSRTMVEFRWIKTSLFPILLLHFTGKDASRHTRNITKQTSVGSETTAPSLSSFQQQWLDNNPPTFLSETEMKWLCRVKVCQMIRTNVTESTGSSERQEWQR